MSSIIHYHPAFGSQYYSQIAISLEDIVKKNMPTSYQRDLNQI
jgi:hypothetical protein